MTDFFEEIHRILSLGDASEKCDATRSLAAKFLKQSENKTELIDGQRVQTLQQAPRRLLQKPSHHSTQKVEPVSTPGYPEQLELVAPRKLKRRGIQSQEGRNILMHAVAHIEYNAINLALDAAYRFRDQPIEYYRDWISIADDEARHFTLIRRYLNQNGCEYGDYAAHNGLWEMAEKTANDVVARMALVPRVLEARGLDVTPGIIRRLKNVDDQAAVEILNIIYEDEIGHVETGSRWFFYQCDIRSLEPKGTFLKMVKKHLHGELRGPFNISARLKAGFDEMEMAYLSKHFD